MGNINLHIANASREFTANEIALFKDAAKKAEEFISKNFSFDYEVDLIIVPPSYLTQTIPEDGITGRTYTSRLVIITVDKSQAKIRRDIVFETICHEMSHSLRWEKLPEHSKTLFDDMIIEGLAIVLEEEAVADAGKQFFLREMQSTDKKMIDGMLAQLDGQLDNKKYDYQILFFDGNEKLPRWTGYRLGYYFVQQHLKRTGNTIAEATLASYSSFKRP